MSDFIENQLSVNSNTIYLANGVTLIVEELPYYSTVSIAFYVNRGSRDESKEQEGFSHFAEHMIFKGTHKETKLSISEKFDSLGGDFNAYTSKEEIVLYAIVPSFDILEALDLMVDMYNNSLFNADEVNLEKEVILNEISMTNEDPQEKLIEEFFSVLFPNNGIGHSITGYKKNISKIDPDKLRNFYTNLFSSDNLIISIAGNCSTEIITKQLNDIQFRRNKTFQENEAIVTSLKNGFTKSSSELLHVVSGTVLPSLSPQNEIYLSLFSLLLGGSMSSRLFHEIRDNLGLCYTINTDIDHFRNQFLFTIYYSVQEKQIKASTNAIRNVIEKLLSFGITNEELEKVKKQKMRSIILSNDNLSKRMHNNIFYHLNYNGKFTKIDLIKTVKDSQLNNINSIINDIFGNGFYTHSLYKKNIKENLCVL